MPAPVLKNQIRNVLYEDDDVVLVERLRKPYEDSEICERIVYLIRKSKEEGNRIVYNTPIRYYKQKASIKECIELLNEL